MNAGDTFEFEDYTDAHRWLIISEPTQDPESVVIVRLVSWTDKSDQACLPYREDYPAFIKHCTCVDFPTADVLPLRKLRRWVADGKIKVKTPLTPAVVARIRSVVDASDIPLKCYDALRSQGLIT